MTNFENSFVRGPSPSYSNVTSENGMSTLPIGDKKTLSDIHKMGYEQMPEKFENPKGRNTFAFWTLVSLLFILTIGNLLLTITIIGCLRLGKGMQSMELVSGEESVKFFGTTDLDRIYKRDGSIEGFIDHPVIISGDNSNVAINLLHRTGHSHNKMMMNKSGTFFKGIDKFEIKDPISGDIIFTTHRPHYTIPKGVDNLHAKVISTSRITSPIGKPLTLQTDGKISLRGSEGLTVESEEVSLQGDQNIYLKSSTNGSIILTGNDGIFLDMDNIPVVNSEYGIRTGSIQYKLCVCMPQGKLFRMPVPRVHNGKITCTHFNPKFDPCL